MLALRAIGLLAVPALVGHLLHRAFAPPREEATWGEVLFLQLFTGLLCCGWPALLLAELGLFSLWAWLLFLAVLCGGVLLWRWPQVRRWCWPHFPRGRKELTGPGLLALLIFLAAALLLLRPGERILGGNDPGVYVSTAAAISRSGGIVQRDPLLPAVPDALRADLFSSYIDQWWQLPGFYITDWSRGEVTPQFLHLFPSWLALFDAAGGLELLLWVLPFFSLLGLAAFYFLVRRLVGPWAAPVALAVLALNPATIWFAREPMSEPLAMVLLLGGWYTFQRALCEPQRRDLALLAGVALGQLGLSKLEFLFLPLLLYGYLFFRSLSRGLRSAERTFLLAYSALWIHALLHLGLISRPYLQTFLTSVAGSRLVLLSQPVLVGVGLGVAVAVVLLFLLRSRLRPVAAWLRNRADLLRAGGALLWLGLAGYGAVVRPLLAPRWVEIQGELLYNYERVTFLRLSWYLSLPGLVLAVVGLAWWIRRRLVGPAVPFFLAFLLQMALYIHRTLDYPYHFWMMRRYLPLLFPLLTLGVAAAILGVRRAPLGPTLRRGGVILLLVLMLLQLLPTALALAPRRELVGLRAALSGVADQVPDGAPLFVQDLAPALATPLRYVEGKAAYALLRPARWQALWALLRDWPPGGGASYLLLGGPPPLLEGGYALVEVGRLELDVAGTEQTLDHLPREVARVQSQQRLLRVERRAGDPGGVEFVLATPAWTGECLAVDLPASSGPVLLWLEAAGFRPPELSEARLAVTWDGRLVAERALAPTWEIEEVALRLEAPLGWRPEDDGVRLQLCVETWNPRQAGYSDDGRDLGVLLRSLRVEGVGR